MLKARKILNRRASYVDPISFDQPHSSVHTSSTKSWEERGFLIIVPADLQCHMAYAPRFGIGLQR